jgi:hypothetical protein
MRVLLLLVVLSACCYAVCVSPLPYYAAAKLLAAGINGTAYLLYRSLLTQRGSVATCADITTHDACRFSNATNLNLNKKCPPACSALLKLTFGACYCLDPNYVPGTGVAPMNQSSVHQLFGIIANKTRPFFSCECRDWMNEASTRKLWTC